MKAFFRTYWMYIKTFFRARAEYRVGFTLGMFSNFYCYFITYCTYWVLIEGLGNIGGWDFSDLSILYGISLLTYALSGTLLWYTVYQLDEMVTKGELDIYLTRPLGIMEQMIFQRFGDTFLGQIAVCAIFLSIAFASQIEIMSVIHFVYLAFCLVGGTMMHAGALILIGSLSFWIKRSQPLGNIFYHSFRNITQYPLSIFPHWIQILLTFVLPWGFINYYPSLILTNKVETIYDLTLGLVAPFVGAVFLLVAIFVFKKGLKKYSGAGS